MKTINYEINLSIIWIYRKMYGSNTGLLIYILKCLLIIHWSKIKVTVLTTKLKTI